MHTLILGEKSDIHVKTVMALCSNTIVLDRSLFEITCKNGSFWLTPGDDVFVSDQLPDPRSVNSVYWRSVDFSAVMQPELNPRNSLACISIALDQYRACTWFNSLNAFWGHINKPLQLRAVNSIGIKIPSTLVTGSAAAAATHLQNFKCIAIKPISGGDYTRKIDAISAHYQLVSIFSHASSPMMVQDFVEGYCVRTYVIDDKVYSAKIESELPDYRIDRQALIVPIRTPEGVKCQALKILHLLGLRWTAIDWIVDSDNNYVFLEANFSPMFHAFSLSTGYPIAEELCKVLQKTRAYNI